MHPSELPAEAKAVELPPRRRVGVPLLAAAAGALATFAVTAVVLDRRPAESPRLPSSTAGVVEASLGHGEADVAAIARSARPAVVGVTAWSGAMPRYGSGVVYRADGVIITTAGLVEGATGIDVVLSDGRTSIAEIVGIDPAYDLAVLRAESLEMTPLIFTETPPTAEMGESCVLVGADHAVEGARAAEGRIASRGRVLKTEDTWLIDVLELEDSVNVEGLGGAVFDASGELLGVVTHAGVRGSGGALAVPASVARRSVEQILVAGRAEHPWIGLAASDSPRPRLGAVIHGVDAASPAARAGFLTGDVVVSVAGHPIRGLESLLREIRRLEIGEEVVVTVLRADSNVDLAVTVEAKSA